MTTFHDFNVVLIFKLLKLMMYLLANETNSVTIQTCTNAALCFLVRRTLAPWQLSRNTVSRNSFWEGGILIPIHLLASGALAREFKGRRLR